MAVCLHPHPHLTSMIPNGQTLKEESEMIAHTWRMGRLWKGLGERVADAAVGYTYFGLLINISLNSASNKHVDTIIKSE